MQGTLQDFRLAEILQLVAVQQKTGMLRVQSPRGTLTFYFDNGMMVSCRDRRHGTEDPLLDYLRRTGWITASLAVRLRKELDGSGLDLVDLLLDGQIVDIVELEGILDDLAQDLIHRSFGWNEGSYQFIAGEEALHGLQHRSQRKVEGLLMEAARRADEWPRLLAKIPGGETLVGGVESVPSDLDGRITKILEALRAPVRMQELVAEARIPEYDVYEIVAQAVESGMAKILELPRQETKSAAAQPVAPRRHKRPGRRIPAVAVWAAVSVTVCIGGALHWVTNRSEPPAVAALHRAAARAAVEQRLETHRALFGHYPASLDELVQADLATPRLIETARVRQFTASLAGRTYQIAYDESP